MPGPERRLAAILSADLAGYSRLMAEYVAARLAPEGSSFGESIAIEAS